MKPRWKELPGLLAGWLVLWARDLRHARRLRRAGFHRNVTVFDGYAFSWYAEPQGLDAARDRPLLVCLHGFLDRGSVFRHVAAVLKPHFRVVIVDLPGHGRSQLPPGGQYWTAAFITERLSRFLRFICRDERPILLTHSMGGLLAMRMALAAPDGGKSTLAGICALAPGAMLSRRKLRELRRLFFPETVEDVRALLVRLSHGRSAQAETREIGDFVCRALLRRWSTSGLHALARNTMKKPEDVFLNHAGLRRVRVPVILLWGSDDRILAPSHALQLEKSLLVVERHIIPGAGHSLLLEAPDAVARVLVDAVRRGFLRGGDTVSRKKRWNRSGN